MCNRKWIDGLDVKLHYGDLTDYSSIEQIISRILPDEIYHLGAQSHVNVSFENPIYTFQANCIGTLNLLEILKKQPKKIKMYNASTSEMLAEGSNLFESSNESTPFNVHSPYAVSKLSAYYLCKIYKEAYDLFICNGILFNHSGPRRGENFILQKIVKGLVNMRDGDYEDFEIGNIKAYRDFGFAGDYVKAMYLMLQQDKPKDYVIATGDAYSIEDVIYEVSSQLGLKAMLGKDDSCFLIEDPCNKSFLGTISISDEYKRPWDVQYLCGDASKARQELGWEPKVKFKELIKIMIEAELKR